MGELILYLAGFGGDNRQRSGPRTLWRFELKKNP